MRTNIITKENRRSLLGVTIKDRKCGGWDLNPRIPEEQGYRSRFSIFPAWLILSIALFLTLPSTLLKRENHRDLRRWPGLATPARKMRTHVSTLSFIFNGHSSNKRITYIECIIWELS